MTAENKVTAPIPRAARRVIVLEETPPHEAAELLDALERAPPTPESIALDHPVSEHGGRSAPGCRAASICYDEKMDGAIAPSPDSVELKRWRFKSADVRRMIEIGILPEKTRFELIHGDLVEKMPEGDAHWDARQRLVDWFYRRLPPEVALAPDGPLRLAEEEEPEPDLFLFPRSMRVNAVRGADALLVVEVADASLAKDRVDQGADLRRPRRARILISAAGRRWCIAIHRREAIRLRTKLLSTRSFGLSCSRRSCCASSTRCRRDLAGAAGRLSIYTS